MKDNFELNERKRQMLLGVVENYIENALPITSEKVQTNLFAKLSSATLRNELSTLEEMGYLKQLHTSSGRVPTTKAYRYFVDTIMNNQSFNEQDIDDIKQKFVTRNTFLLDILNSFAAKMGEITNYPTFVTMSGYDELTIKGVNIIKLITGNALVLIQTQAGITNSTINLSPDITDENCKDASKFLTTNLFNKKISHIIENYDKYQKLFVEQIGYFDKLFESITNILKEYIVQKSSIINKGSTSKLINDFDNKNFDNAIKLIDFVENEKGLKSIINDIDKNSNNDIVFSIGEENDQSDFSDYSIVKANYHLSDGITASIGVVGPERMDYAKIASTLKYIVDEITAIQNDKQDKGDKNE